MCNQLLRVQCEPKPQPGCVPMCTEFQHAQKSTADCQATKELEKLQLLRSTHLQLLTEHQYSESFSQPLCPSVKGLLLKGLYVHCTTLQCALQCISCPTSFVVLAALTKSCVDPGLLSYLCWHFEIRVRRPSPTWNACSDACCRRNCRNGTCCRAVKPVAQRIELITYYTTPSRLLPGWQRLVYRSGVESYGQET